MDSVGILGDLVTNVGIPLAVAIFFYYEIRKARRAHISTLQNHIKSQTEVIINNTIAFTELRCSIDVLSEIIKRWDRKA